MWARKSLGSLTQTHDCLKGVEETLLSDIGPEGYSWGFKSIYLFDLPDVFRWTYRNTAEVTFVCISLGSRVEVKE